MKKKWVVAICVLSFAVCMIGLFSNDAKRQTEDLEIPGDFLVDVDPTHFIAESLVASVTKEQRALSDRTKTMCYVIRTRSIPHEHGMGPWAPKTVLDGKEAGGIWLKDGKVFDVDGPFVKNAAQLYDDPEWKLYNDDGTVRVTETKEAFEAAARPDVDPRYENHVVEGRAEWVADTVTTYVIPVTPIYSKQPQMIAGPGGGPPGGGPPHRPHGHGPPPGGPPHRGGGGGGPIGQGGIGIAFNGVNFDPPAPIEAIIGAHTIAPFDDAGGHINPHEGYHYHAATGRTKEIAQEDGHAPMIGYILDGFGLYAHLDAEGSPPKDLDEYGGHYDEVRGYHYHAGNPGSNLIIKGFRGVPGSVATEPN